MRSLLLFGLFVSSAQTAFPAAFRNLGFEEGNIQNLQSGDSAAVNQLLPGWQVTGSDSSVPDSGMYYDLVFAGFEHGPSVSLYDTKTRHGVPQEGSFFLGMTEDLSAANSQLIHWSIKQRGDVPADTKSLFFYDMSGALSGGGGGAGFQLEINGSEVPLVRLGQYLMGADVSAYAGENVDLAFQSMPFFHLDPGFWGLDGISFSAAPIPEPSTWAILSCGVLLLIRSRRP